ncbi:hypothetical protein QFC20_002886 [Naganishia adeliensis]|uniref:Uncharacterized protein n=1 Tax=Naganishia adeliensis TaxID=92952 RepID=A0ACC2WFW8_9TREE|nr:hypothetical protein QFC20_002886 [Naganishia adeliensis]
MTDLDTLRQRYIDSATSLARIQDDTTGLVAFHLLQLPTAAQPRPRLHPSLEALVSGSTPPSASILALRRICRVMILKGMDSGRMIAPWERWALDGAFGEEEEQVGEMEMVLELEMVPASQVWSTRTRHEVRVFRAMSEMLWVVSWVVEFGINGMRQGDEKRQLEMIDCDILRYLCACSEELGDVVDMEDIRLRLEAANPLSTVQLLSQLAVDKGEGEDSAWKLGRIHGRSLPRQLSNMLAGYPRDKLLRLDAELSLFAKDSRGYIGSNLTRGTLRVYLLWDNSILVVTIRPEGDDHVIDVSALMHRMSIASSELSANPDGTTTFDLILALPDARRLTEHAVTMDQDMPTVRRRLARVGLLEVGIVESVVDEWL